MDDTSLHKALQSLTQRQRDVFRLVCEEKSHKEISQELHITVATVKYHLTNVYTKLNISHLTPAQRQRLLGKLFPTLPELSEPQVSHDTNESIDDQSLEDHQDLENVDEPSQYALAVIEAVSAVVEDEYYWLAKAPDRRDRRRSWWRMPLLRTFVPWIACFMLGVLVTGVVLNQQPQGEARTPSGTSPIQDQPTAATVISSAGTTVRDESLVCGEQQRTVAPTHDRFLRQQGVSLFSVENTEGALINNAIRSLAIDPKGLWIGYFATPHNRVDGVGHFDKQTWAICGMPLGIAGNNINDIEVDRIGRIWFATENSGVAMFSGTDWYTYTTTTDPGLPDNRTFGLTVDAEGTVWLATLEGIARFDGIRWSTIYTAGNKTIYYNNTHDIAFDRDGNIWVGHIHNGVSEYRQSEQRWIHHTATPEGLGGSLIRNIVTQPRDDGTEAIWFATEDGGVSVYHAGKWTVYRQHDGLPHDAVKEVALDPHGRIWAATLGGVAYFDGTRWIRYHSIPARSIAFGAACEQCPFEKSDHVWTGTADAGLTHSRLPYHEEAVTITEVCFVLEEQNRSCERFPPIRFENNQSVITLTYPRALRPKEQFQVEIFAAPNTPYRFREGDKLVNLDEKPDGSDVTVFKTHVHIAVSQLIEPGQPYKFADYNKPLEAPELPQEIQEQTFTSVWRMWMHTRYAGPYVHIQFRVEKDAQVSAP